MIDFNLQIKKSQQDPDLLITILDIDSLFTIILLDKTNQICIENSCTGKEYPTNISMPDFRNLNNITTKNPFLCLATNIINMQMVESPLDPALARIFCLVVSQVEDLEIVLIISKLCSIDVTLKKSVHCPFIRYNQPDKWREYLSSKHLNVIFSSEK